MTEKTIKEIKEKLSRIEYPGFSRDIISFGVVKDIRVKESEIMVEVTFTTQDEDTKLKIKSDIQKTLKEEYPDNQIMIDEKSPAKDKSAATAAAGDPWAGRAPIPGIKNIIAVASGKGGVGKSTVSTNLAIALAKNNLKIGLMDSDIYGPSVHIMMGINERPMVTPDQKIIPIKKYGISMMSMGFLVDPDAPLIWRGPMVMKAVEQFLRDVQWEELDVLVIDLPPGTGDAQLTLVQKTPLTGAIIVTTPQEVALVDARRGLKMFQKVNTPVLGLIENMSYFICPHCNEKSYIFGSEGGLRSAKELSVSLLGQIPIEPEVTEAGDSGNPIVSRNPASASGKAFEEVAQKLIQNKILDIQN